MRKREKNVVITLLECPEICDEHKTDVTLSQPPSEFFSRDVIPKAYFTNNIDKSAFGYDFVRRNGDSMFA